jgi:hypothetical protein
VFRVFPRLRPSQPCWQCHGFHLHRLCVPTCCTARAVSCGCAPKRVACMCICCVASERDNHAVVLQVDGGVPLLFAPFHHGHSAVGFRLLEGLALHGALGVPIGPYLLRPVFAQPRRDKRSHSCPALASRFIVAQSVVQPLCAIRLTSQVTLGSPPWALLSLRNEGSPTSPVGRLRRVPTRLKEQQVSGRDQHVRTNRSIIHGQGQGIHVHGGV